MRGVKEPISNGAKYCTRCRNLLALTNFYKDRTRPDKYKPVCKDCQRVYKHWLRHRDIQETRKKERISHARYKDRWQAKDRERRYGLDPNAWEAMMLSQQGTCAICKQSPKGLRSLCIDHCHKTGRVRGLLCDRCNLFAGWIEKDPAYGIGLGVYTVLEYLRAWDSL